MVKGFILQFQMVGVICSQSSAHILALAIA